MDKGDRSADIELKSGLSHPRVKHYRRMWKDERHDRRLRSKKRLRRKVRRSDEPIQLPLRSKPACGQELESSQVATSGGEKGKRKHRVARGLRERKANARTEDARSRLPESIGMQLKPADYPHGVENQLVIRLHEKPTH